LETRPFSAGSIPASSGLADSLNFGDIGRGNGHGVPMRNKEIV
jgi:hypothetical protein